MKKCQLTLLAAGTILMAQCVASAQDNHDKVKHFVVSMAFGGVSETVLHHKTGLSAAPRIALGAFIGSIPGLIKEVHDGKQRNDSFSRGDMAADIAGAFAGSVLCNFINRKIKATVIKKPKAAHITIAYRF
jgi:uncharacterized protein YfiM (DUF2279 family)